MSLKPHAVAATVALLLAAYVSQAGDNIAATPGYYDQVASLLDPGNEAPGSQTADVQQTYPRELCGVKVGMAVNEVIAVWGKPQAFRSASWRGMTLKYGAWNVEVITGGVRRIWFDPRAPNAKPSVDGKTSRRPGVWAPDCREMLRDKFTTNDAAIPALLTTNAVIPMDRLKVGGVGGVRLGMTMAEAVAAVGKPRCFCGFATNRATLYYGEYSLGFRGDRLSSVYASMPEPVSAIRFDNGLTGMDSASSFRSALGGRIRTGGEYRTDDERSVCCECGSVWVYFRFYTPVDFSSGKAVELKPQLGGIVVRYHGLEEIRNEAIDKFIDAVALALNLEREKLEDLNSVQALPDAASVVEKAVGKPLTEKQREIVVTALETRLQAVRNAREAGEW